MSTDTEEPVRKKKLTQEQLEVIKNPTKPGTITKITAYAGTGKTSTLSAYSEFHHQDSALYLAFNKSVAEEARSRFQLHVQPSTIHGLAYRAMNARRFGNIATRIRYGLVMKLFRLRELYLAAAVLATFDNYLNSADDKTTLKHIHDPRKRFKPDELLKFSDTLFDKMRDGQDQVPMTHSGYLKLYQLSKPVIHQKLIMLDEAQDTNPVTFDVVLRQVREQKAKLIMVGDRRQAIYGWRGAINAMDMETQQSFYLTQSFRFGPAVAELANGILSHIFKETVLLKGRPDQPTQIVPAAPQKHTCICRTNYNLVTDSILSAQRGQKVCLAGDYESFLSDLMDTYSLWAGLYGKITSPYIRAFGQFHALKDFAGSGFDQELKAKVQLVEHFQNSVPDVLEVLAKARTSDEQADIYYTTVHKAKGREWAHVRLLQDFMDEPPTPEEEQDMPRELEEEYHALYVATTRPLDSLVPTAFLYELRLADAPAAAQPASPESAATPLFEPETESPQTGPPPLLIPPHDKPARRLSLHASLAKQEEFLQKENAELLRRGKKTQVHEE